MAARLRHEPEVMFGAGAAAILRKRVEAYQSIERAVESILSNDMTAAQWVKTDIDPGEAPWAVQSVDHAFVDITNVGFRAMVTNPWEPTQGQYVWGSLPAGEVLDRLERMENESTVRTDGRRR